MKLIGKAHKFGDNIDTDVIIPYKYKARTINPYELAEHVMEGIEPNFSKKVSKGDFIVAGKNFGCGSSREQAPIAIKFSGILCVIAESFARIFYRNSMNIGLPLLVCNNISALVKQGDLLEVNLKEGLVRILNKNKKVRCERLPEFMIKILSSGGLVEFYKQKQKLLWD